MYSEVATPHPTDKSLKVSTEHFRIYFRSHILSEPLCSWWQLTYRKQARPLKPVVEKELIGSSQVCHAGVQEIGDRQAGAQI